MNINKEDFLKMVEANLESLKIINKPHTDDFLLNMEKEREKNKMEKMEKNKKQLIDKIKSLTEIKVQYGTLFNAFVRNDSLDRREYRFAISDIDVNQDYIFDNNHYKDLDSQTKLSLFELLKTQIQKANFLPVNEYLQKIEVLKEYSVTEEEEKEFIQHFKNLLIAYFKGHILKNEVDSYLIESLPSVLWLIEKSQPKSLFNVYLLRYPANQTTEETREEFLLILKKWYQEKGNKFTSIENYLEETIKNNNFDLGSDVFYYYQYLFTDEFHQKKEQELINMLYNRYLEYQKIEDSLQREHRINDISNELYHFLKK